MAIRSRSPLRRPTSLGLAALAAACALAAPVACKTAQPPAIGGPPPTAAVTVPTASASPTAAPPASASATGSASGASAPAREPEPLVPPSAVACRLDFTAHLGKRLAEPAFGGGEALYPLAFAPGRPPFATVFAAEKGELTVPVGPAAAGTFLRAEYAAVALGGVVAASELHLCPQRAFALRGILVPRPETLLELRAGADGRVTLAPGSMEDTLLEMTSGALEDARPCADVGAERASFDLGSLVPKRPGRPMYLVAKTPIAATDTDPPIAVLEPAGDLQVEVVAQSQKRARIVASQRGFWVVAWVAQSALAATPPGVAYGSNGPIPGPRSAFAMGIALGRRATCAHDVPLLAYQGDEGRVAGVLRAGHPIGLTSEEPVGGELEIYLRVKGLLVESGTTWRVRARDLEDCPVSER
ncbi:MAG: hypothetical protein IT373_27645 [Polyangiaceae bacterium]|nr:hypothetical protein [Polyangiaceae bacterium]